jgi:hypothetical protein
MEMAEEGGDHNVVEAEAQKITECAICRGRMTNPRALTCLHSFCEECLQGVIDAARNDTINCPSCNSEQNIPPNGAKGFEKNFHIANLIEALTIKEARDRMVGGIKCEIDNKEATAKCIDCDQFLCQDCVNTHTKLKATRDHPVVPLDQMEDVQLVVRKRYCDIHPGKELELFCKDCKKMICRDGGLVEHKSHEFKFINNILDELKDDIKRVQDEVEDKLDEFKAHYDYIGQVSASTDENVGKCNKDIDDYFDELIARAEEKRQELKEQLETTENGHRKHLSAHHTEVETSVAKLESVKEFSQSLLDKGIRVDMGMMYNITMNRLNSLKGLMWDRKSIQSSQWTFQRPAEGDNPFNAKVNGNFKPNDIIVECLTQPHMGDNSFVVNFISEYNSMKPHLAVKITRDEEEDIEPVIADTADDSWEVNYHIAADGLYCIKVMVDGVEARGSPFVKRWKYRLEAGMRVRRGPDWRWGNQDGGPNAQGTVVGWSEQVGATNNWAKIKWDNGNRQNNYRWGAENAYDLEIVVDQSDVKGKAYAFITFNAIASKRKT